MGKTFLSFFLAFKIYIYIIYLFIYLFTLKLFLGSVESHFIIIHQKVMVDKQRGGFVFRVLLLSWGSWDVPFLLPSLLALPSSKLLHTRRLS
jgi:hypothetical protein